MFYFNAKKCGVLQVSLGACTGSMLHAIMSMLTASMHRHATKIQAGATHGLEPHTLERVLFNSASLLTVSRARKSVSYKSLLLVTMIAVPVRPSRQKFCG